MLKIDFIKLTDSILWQQSEKYIYPGKIIIYKCYFKKEGKN